MIYSYDGSHEIKRYFRASRRGVLQLAPVGFLGDLARGGERCSIWARPVALARAMTYPIHKVDYRVHRVCRRQPIRFPTSPATRVDHPFAEREEQCSLQ